MFAMKFVSALCIFCIVFMIFDFYVEAKMTTDVGVKTERFSKWFWGKYKCWYNDGHTWVDPQETFLKEQMKDCSVCTRSKLV
jgi:hypothetical protein